MSYGVFDLHAHVVFDDALGRSGSYGPRHGHDEEGREFFQVGSYTMKPIPYSTSLFMNVDSGCTVGIERMVKGTDFGGR